MTLASIEPLCLGTKLLVIANNSLLDCEIYAVKVDIRVKRVPSRSTEGDMGTELIKYIVPQGIDAH